MDFSPEDYLEIKEQLSKLLRDLPEQVDERDIDHLYNAAITSIEIFNSEIMKSKKFRITHDLLRKVWRKCSLSKPTAKTIKDLTLQLSDEAFNAIRRRGDHLFRVETGLDFTRENFNLWVRKAKKKDLVRFLMNLISEENHVLEGRRYRNGKQGRNRIEPQIMGYVRRGERLEEIKEKKRIDPSFLSPSTTNRHRNLGGFQQQEAANDLIRNLSCDFYGAINKTPFEDPVVTSIYDKFIDLALGWIEKDVPKMRIKNLRDAVIQERKTRKTVET